MNDFDERRPKELPELDRRVLDAARREQPSTELSARMASALGLSAAAMGVASRAAAARTAEQAPLIENTIEPALQTTKAAIKGTGATSSSGSFWSGWMPWGSGVMALAIGSAIVAQSAPMPAPPLEISTSAAIEQPIPPLPSAPAPSLASSAAIVSPSHRVKQATLTPERSHISPVNESLRPTSSHAASDLSAEIARLDGARSAMAAGAHARALDALRQYELTYPRGNFRPEATALRVECLIALGRADEARSLAKRFIGQHRGSRLADRVAQLVGIEAP